VGGVGWPLRTQRLARAPTPSDDAFPAVARGAVGAAATAVARRGAADPALDSADAARPRRPHPDDIALLDGLPYLRLNLARAPQPLLRALFEASG